MTNTTNKESSDKNCMERFVLYWQMSQENEMSFSLFLLKTMYFGRHGRSVAYLAT